MKRVKKLVPGMESRLVPWFGSKAKMAFTIITELGPHDYYVEPFCGSMTILLRKEPSQSETVNDLHGDLINLAGVIQDDELGPQLFDKCLRTLWSEKLFKKIAKRHVQGATGLIAAYDYFVLSWMGRKGYAGMKDPRHHFSVKWGAYEFDRWVESVDSIPEWSRRLRGVRILKRDALVVLDKIKDEKGIAIYVDPPYLIEGDQYQHGFTLKQHKQLAEILCKFKKARVVVSNYADGRLMHLYPGWTQKKIKVNKIIKVGSGSSKESYKEKVEEVLVINGPSVSLLRRPGFFY